MNAERLLSPTESHTTLRSNAAGDSPVRAARGSEGTTALARQDKLNCLASAAGVSSSKSLLKKLGISH